VSSPYYQELYSKKIFFFRLIWGVLTIQGFFFTAVVFLNDTLKIGNLDAISSIESTITFFALILAIASYSLRKFFLSDKKIAEIINTPIHPDDLARLTQYHGNFIKIKTKVEALSEYEKSAYNLIHYSFLPHLISWIMNEAILLMGVALAFSIGNPYKIIPFALTHLALNIYMFPDIDGILAKARGFYRGGFEPVSG